MQPRRKQPNMERNRRKPTAIAVFVFFLCRRKKKKFFFVRSQFQWIFPVKSKRKRAFSQYFQLMNPCGCVFKPKIFFSSAAHAKFYGTVNFNPKITLNHINLINRGTVSLHLYYSNNLAVFNAKYWRLNMYLDKFWKLS